MALPTDTAIVPIDHELAKPRPGQPNATSLMPLQATVEDYFSGEEADSGSRMNATKKDINENMEQQRKSPIRVSALPKQANVSWFDKSAPSDESRRSRISQATTAVPPSPEPLDRPPLRNYRMIDPKDIHLDQSNSQPISSRPSRRENERSRISQATTAVPPSPDIYLEPRDQRRPNTRTARPNQVRWVDDDYSTTSESAEDENEYHRREPRRSTNNLPPGPTPYTQPINKAPQSFNYMQEMQYPGLARYFEPQNMYPAHSTYPGYGAPPAMYQSWPYPYPYEHPEIHETYGSAFRHNQIYPGPYNNRLTTPWNYDRHSLHPPRPLQPPVKPATQNESNDLAVTRLIPARNDAQQKGSDVKESSRTSEKLEDLLEKYQQAFKPQNEVQQKTTAVKQIESPSSTIAHKEGPLPDLDLIQLMGDRILDLKRKNEEKLLEANQVLKYLGQNSYPEQRRDNDQRSPSQVQDARSTYVRIPTVYQFRTFEDEPDHEDADGTSVTTDQDSIAGNSSGSSTLSLAPISRQVQFSPAIAGPQRDRRAESVSVDFDDDESINSTEPEEKSTVSRAELEMSNLRVTGGTVNKSSGQGVVKSAEVLATELDMMGELIALRRDLSVLKRQMVQGDQTWGTSIARPFLAHFRRYFRKMPRPGTQRLEWTCECGEDMYADLPIENGAQYQQMLEFLTRSGTRSHQANPDQRTPSQLEGGTNPADYSSLQSSQSSLGKSVSPASTIGSGSTYVGTGTSQILTAQGNDSYGQSKYLELCVNTSKYETKLAEIQVLSGQSVGTAICTDGHLFRQIHQRYYALRKQNWRRFLYRPAGIKFVHFGVQAGDRVSFFSSDPLPPEDEIVAKRYEYDPQPPVPPPMDSRTFLHYFHRHNAHAQSTSAKYVNRLPKKLGDSLTRSLGVDDLLEGWGIHIIEGPNKVAICWALFLVLVASLVASILYDFLMRSGESGFAIGQWMVAALTVGLSALYFSLEDDVNTSFA